MEAVSAQSVMTRLMEMASTSVQVVALSRMVDVLDNPPWSVPQLSTPIVSVLHLFAVLPVCFIRTESIWVDLRRIKRRLVRSMVSTWMDSSRVSRMSIMTTSPCSSKHRVSLFCHITSHAILTFYPQLSTNSSTSAKPNNPTTPKSPSSIP